MKKILFLVVGLCAATSYAQPLTSPQIDSIAELTLKTFEVPGIAVLVIKDGKIIHSKGYGVRSLNTMQKVDDNTLFGIASNSKAFTATGLGMLIDEGKLKWTDKVIDYLPEFRMYNTYVTDEFTIADLLTHRSGLGLGAGDLMFWPDSSDFTKKDMIHNLRYLKQVSGFRTKFDYDNNLYLVAGEVLAKVAGMSWEEFIQTRILTPLGMTATAPSFKLLKDKSNVIDPHAPVDGKVKVIRRDWNEAANAAGGIYSNLNDISKWIIMQLNNGKYGEGLNKTLISEEVHNDLWTQQTIIPVNGPSPYNTHFAGYGLGFFLSDVKGYKQVSHTGGLAGIVTQITMLPELKLAIIVFTNQQSGAAFTAITNSIKDGYFGIKDANRVKQQHDNVVKNLENAKKITDQLWKDIDSVQKTNKAKPDLSKYAGTFTDKWFGDIVVSEKNGKLWITSKRSFLLSGEMMPYKANSFIVKWTDRSMDADAFVNYSVDENGNPAGIKMKAISPLTDFSFDFHDLDLVRTK